MGTAAQERAAAVVLVLAMAAAAATLLALGRELIFFNDELGWLASSRDYEPATLLQPHNSHLIAIPRAIYGTLARVFGPEYVTFRIVAVAGVLLCAGLFFVLARRRVGALPALAPTIVLLFFGSAWNVVLSPIGIPFLYSLAAGLGALVAIERGDRSGDVAATLLLLGSIASHTFGVIFTIGIATYVLLRPERRSRAYVFVLPLALYAAWWVWAQKFDQGIAEAGNVVGVPVFVAESFAAVVTALTGLNVDVDGVPGTDVPVSFDWTLAPLLAALGLVGLGLALRRSRPGPSLWAFAAILLAFWIGLGLSEAPGRQPTTSRYLFPGAVMLLLVVAEALRGARFSRTALVALFALAAIGIAGNLVHLTTARQFLLAYSADARAQLAALELAGDGVPGEFRVADLAPRGSRYLVVPARSHLAAVRRWGSFALAPEEIAAQPERVRADVDLVLARAQGLLAVPAPQRGPRERCRSFDAAGGDAQFELEPGTSLVKISDGGLAPLTLRRFGDAFTVAVGDVPADGSLISIPIDGSAVPWRGSVPASVQVCPQQPASPDPDEQA